MLLNRVLLSVFTPEHSIYLELEIIKNNTDCYCAVSCATWLLLFAICAKINFPLPMEAWRLLLPAIPTGTCLFPQARNLADISVNNITHTTSHYSQITPRKRLWRWVRSLSQKLTMDLTNTITVKIGTGELNEQLPFV